MHTSAIKNISTLAVRISLMLVLLFLIFHFLSCSQNPASTTAKPYQVNSGTTNFVEAVQMVLPSVVQIEVTYGAQGSPDGSGASGAAGTGWVLDANGYIVTNDHVIEGAKTITVILSDKTKYVSTAVQGDVQNDLAVIKIRAQNLKPVKIGDSSGLMLAQPVCAVGNSLNLGLRATVGVVSQLHVSIPVNNKTLDGLIETDATINPGNSGGVLINSAGEVVGIPNSGLADPTVDPENTSYAISINDAMPIINGLKAKLP
jgi:serine protease Do